MKPIFIYLDNAASTQVAPEVVEEMKRFLNEAYGNPSSAHSFGLNAREAVEKAREIVARKIGALPEEIVFTSGGTEGINLAIKGTVTKQKNHVVTTTAEHQATLNVCRELEEHQYPVSYIAVDRDGFVSARDIEHAITPKTALVSVIHGNNEIGTVNDIAAIGKVCRKKGVLFHVDACQSFLKVLRNPQISGTPKRQSVLKEQIDVQHMNIDLMTLNAHKVHGPKGVGALFVRKGVKLRPLFHGGNQEAGIRAGTENVPGIVGFGKAVELWKESDNEKMRKLRDHLIVLLLKIKDSRLNGNVKRRLCNNVNVSFKGILGDDVIKHLDQQGIMASTGSACTSHHVEASHVLKAIGLPDEWAFGSIRLSLSRYTTSPEIEQAALTLRTVVESLRKL